MLPKTTSRNHRPTTLQQLAPYMGMGIQLAAAMTVFGGLGWWLDGRFETTPWLLVAGVMLGAVGGMISIIRTAIRSSSNRRSANPDKPEEERGREAGK